MEIQQGDIYIFKYTSCVWLSNVYFLSPDNDCGQDLLWLIKYDFWNIIIFKFSLDKKKEIEKNNSLEIAI